MDMKKKLTLLLVSGFLVLGTAAAVSAGPPGPTEVPEGNPYCTTDEEGNITNCTPPVPEWPTTPDDCRWTGYYENADGEQVLDSAYWEYYRVYYNWLDEDNGVAGDRYFGKQGDCMKNRGTPLYPAP